jgi:hypothetical membrane protein
VNGDAPHARALAAAATAAVASGATLVLLHLAQPGLDPGWSVVSQYALGAHGWLAAVMFLLLGAACVLLAVGLPGSRLRRAGRIGRVLLLVAAGGLVVAAVFPVGDPLHEVGSLLGNLGLAVAAVLVGRDLRRGLPPGERHWAAVAAHAPWIAAVLMAAFIATTTWGVGLLNRAVVLAYLVWIVLVARQALTRRGAPVEPRRSRRPAPAAPG